jgi:hypothetical protein
MILPPARRAQRRIQEIGRRGAGAAVDDALLARRWAAGGKSPTGSTDPAQNRRVEVQWFTLE